MKDEEARIKKARARTVIRPAVEVLEGMVGPDAAQAWQARHDAGDFDRISIERNELHT